MLASGGDAAILGAMSEQLQPKQTSVKSRLLRPVHPFFWGIAEKQLDAIQHEGKNGHFSSYPWLVEIGAGPVGGSISVFSDSMDNMVTKQLTVNFSRDELSSRLDYLRAERVVSSAAGNKEQSTGMVLASPQEILVADFNPVSVLRALHGASVSVAKG